VGKYEDNHVPEWFDGWQVIKALEGPNLLNIK
jgi:hypothetical protein